MAETSRISIPVNKSAELRLTVLEMIAAVKKGHIGGVFLLEAIWKI